MLTALFPGFVALADRVVRALPGLGRGVAEGVVAVLVAAALVALAPGANHEKYFAAPAEAGRLVEAVGPAAGQDTAWHTPQVPWPTWVSRAWGLEPSAVGSPEDVATVGDHDRVVVRLDRLPAFLDGSVGDDALAVRGNYAVVTGVVLRRHLLSE